MERGQECIPSKKYKRSRYSKKCSKKYRKTNIGQAISEKRYICIIY